MSDRNSIFWDIFVHHYLEDLGDADLSKNTRMLMRYTEHLIEFCTEIRFSVLQAWSITNLERSLLPCWQAHVVIWEQVIMRHHHMVLQYLRLIWLGLECCNGKQAAACHTLFFKISQHLLGFRHAFISWRSANTKIKTVAHDQDSIYQPSWAGCQWWPFSECTVTSGITWKTIFKLQTESVTNLGLLLYPQLSAPA